MISSRKIVTNVLTTDFRKACQIITASVPHLQEDEVLVKTKYVGINATDINVTAGRYGPSKQTLPFDVGLEGIGEIAEVGRTIPQSMVGNPVGYIWNGCFSEYIKLPVKVCIPLPDIKPQYVPLLISGLTASISLEEMGRISGGKNVLVTAAAGGTGHIAVQIAKLAGCHVIGTCSNEAKMEFLQSIGCDHVINYKSEALGKVLTETYSSGIDIVYESIGGEIFNACVNNLAVNGRMIVLGYINSYHSPGGIDRSHRNATLITKLLLKSASISGFFLMNHSIHYKSHLEKLVKLLNNGNLQVLTDQHDKDGKKFYGLESVFDAVDHLYSQKSKGKVIVQLPN